MTTVLQHKKVYNFHVCIKILSLSVGLYFVYLTDKEGIFLKQFIYEVNPSRVQNSQLQLPRIISNEIFLKYNDYFTGFYLQK